MKWKSVKGKKEEKPEAVYMWKGQ